MQKSVFDKVAYFIEIVIVFALYDAVLFRGNHRLHSLRRRFFENGVGIVSFIGKQCLSLYAADKRESFLTIRSGTFSDKYSDRHTMRIHGQMYFGIEPPFERLIF